MHVTPRRIALRLLPAVFAAIVLSTVGQPLYAQIAPQNRSFLMALWTDPARDLDTDIATFWAPDKVAPAPGTEPQPAAPQRTILLSHIPSRSLYQESYDWSRMVAVEFDEPYAAIDKQLNCAGLPAAGQQIDAQLAQRSAELKVLAPKARFWVNLSPAESDWILANHCSSLLNRAYIDVLSFDRYNSSPTDISSRLQELTTHPARQDQQFALIPGVYSAPNDQWIFLSSYFTLAEQQNMTSACSLPLGNRGVTGYADGCPVWIVLGWESVYATDNHGTTYTGMLEPGSQYIKRDWEAELRLPLAPVLARQRTPAQTVQPILQQLLLP